MESEESESCGYFVLHKRDRNGEAMDRCKGRLMYDKIKKFETQSRAVEFALSHLSETPIVAKTVKAVTDFQQGADYVVAAYFPNKYSHYSYDGSSDAVPTHEVVQCKQENLDSVVETIVNENPAKIYLGIEQKLIPTAFDRIRSVNRTGDSND